MMPGGAYRNNFFETDYRDKYLLKHVHIFFNKD